MKRERVALITNPHVVSGFKAYSNIYAKYQSLENTFNSAWYLTGCM